MIEALLILVYMAYFVFGGLSAEEEKALIHKAAHKLYLKKKAAAEYEAEVAEAMVEVEEWLEAGGAWKE